MTHIRPIDREIRHFHLFAGLGGGAKGFRAAKAELGPLRARFRCIGGIDNDPAAMRDFARLAGVPGTCLDLFDRAQYRDFHGAEPPVDWREATPDDIRRAASGERPHIVFLSPPCKGLSGLLSETRSAGARYQALNRLTVRGIWLMLEAWADDPPELVILENVPRIATRGRKLLDRIGELLRAYGYATAETTHDCGVLGGLAQSRKRFLLVARHRAKVPPFLYEPPQQRLRGVGEILERLPAPGDPAAGPMHRVPALQWKTWVRLAFVEAGSDWRSLNKLRVADGVLQDFAIAPEAAFRGGFLGVRRWEDTTGVVSGRGGPTNGAYSVADPRYAATGEYGQLGVQGWDESASTIRHIKSPIQGRFSVADPRHDGPAKHTNEFRIVAWNATARTVTSAHGSGQCVADPRMPEGAHASKYRVTGVDEPAGAVIGASTTGQGAFAVADPRTGLDPNRPSYRTGGHYGVAAWSSPTGAISQARQCHTGPWTVADPRIDLPVPETRLVCRIRALDGTWHRPFTTLDLAALQSLVDPEEMLALDGLSDAAWRERIGNAVPPDAAQAIAETMARTLLLAWTGESFMLSNVPIWVRPAAVALSLGQPEQPSC